MLELQELASRTLREFKNKQTKILEILLELHSLRISLTMCVNETASVCVAIGIIMLSRQSG